MASLSISRIQQSASVVIRRFARRCALVTATLALCLTLTAGLSSGAIRAEDTTPSYVVNHSYVNYTADHVPCSQGTVVDITGGVAEEDGHVYDIYHNELVFNPDNSISDANSQVVGFVYRVSTVQ